jgi:nicotinate-nucleotide--dimethylbenzimidazole phosphoribosyltransferase
MPMFETAVKLARNMAVFADLGLSAPQGEKD